MKRSMLSHCLFAIPLITACSFPVHADPWALEQGIQFGDLEQGSVMVWSRANRDSRMMIEYALNENFNNSKIVRGPYALSITDYTAKQALTNLPVGTEIYVKVWFEDLTNQRNKSEATVGHFRTLGNRDGIRFVWGADTAGQGYGINEAFGGMKIYSAMRETKPHFFIHSGDNIYADNPILPSVTLPNENNQVWTNVVTPEVAKVAETLNEFRGRYKYNLLDANVRAFNAEVPQIWQWDDHEVVNNWSDSKDLSGDARYTVKDVPLLTARAATAFKEFSAQRPQHPEELDRVYRKISYGKLLEVFVLDMRSYRGPNTKNNQTTESADTAFLGEEQINWLQDQLKKSKATWKVIAADMPIGLNISDDFANNPPQRWEGVANGDHGLAMGRELETARLLSNIKRVKNVVWLTGDVHYAAAHYYDPNKAATKDFTGFWEFVAGPLNAGSFGPNTTDGTFGPQVEFYKAPPAGKVNLSPYAGLQFFGEVNINPSSKTLTVDFKDLNGVSVFSKTLNPQ